jgi:hypothetical protein
LRRIKGQAKLKISGGVYMIENPKWAISRENRAISLFQSSVNPSHPIVLIGGVHGDEPEGVALAEATLKWLKAESAQSKVETLCPWIVIPCLNPDGYFNNERTNGGGVDLNRNYPSRDWSPEALKPRYQPGPSAASEPEIKALVQLIKDVKPRLLIHCHSWNPCIVYAGEPARADAEALGLSSGYEVRDDIGYPTPGSLSRYGWHDLKIPVICIEEAEKTPLNKIWPHFAIGMKTIFTNHSLRAS